MANGLDSFIMAIADEVKFTVTKKELLATANGCGARIQS